MLQEDQNNPMGGQEGGMGGETPAAPAGGESGGWSPTPAPEGGMPAEGGEGHEGGESHEGDAPAEGGMAG